jgi:hypothetical protein
MQWLATDFIEERKWKRAAARVLGEEAMKNLPNSEESKEQTTTTEAPPETPKGTEGEGKDVEVAVEMEVEDTGETCTPDDVSANVPQNLIQYDPVSEEDVASAKTVAKTLSNMVLDMVLHVDDHEIDVNTKDEESRCPSSTAPPSSTTDTDRGTVPNLQQQWENDQATRNTKEQVFLSISNHVDSMLQKLKKAGNKKSSSTNKTTASQLPVPLSTRQQSMLDTIQGVIRLGAGAILGGPPSCGKTILVCSLLWKKRSDGPQLIVCSPASMVRLWRYFCV